MPPFTIQQWHRQCWRVSRDKDLYNMIQQRGSMCLMKAGRVFDKEYAQGNKGIYEELVKEGADVIETNLTNDVAKAIAPLTPAKAQKESFLVKQKLKVYG